MIRQRNKPIDGLRGFALLLIVIWHYGHNQLSNNPSETAYYFKLLTSYFWSGVDLFFVLSGFLLGGILLRNKTSENYFKTFYIRRICRIFPIYYLSLIAILTIVLVGFEQITAWENAGDIPYWSYFAFTQNIFMGINATFGNRWLAHTWSLALEEQFYLILPFLIYFLNTRRLLIILSIAIATSPLFRYLSDNWYEAFNFLHCRFDALFTGVICAYLFQNEKAKSIMVKYRSIIAFLLMIAILFIGLMSIKKITIPYFLENTLLSATYCLLIVLLLLSNGKSMLARLFSNTLLVKLGLISYAVYLFHQPMSGLIHYLFFHQSPQVNSYEQLAATLFSLALSIGLATLTYHFIEKPIINYGHRYNY